MNHQMDLTSPSYCMIQWNWAFAQVYKLDPSSFTKTTMFRVKENLCNTSYNLKVITALDVFATSIGGYWWLLMVIILVAIGVYSIFGFWWLLIIIILVVIGGYYVNGYRWLFC